MKEVDEKVFLFMNSLMQLGIIEFEKDFAEAIGVKRQNVNNIKNGISHFTTKHIHNISKVFGGNPNYFFGLEENMFRKKSK
ncbi:helix-turn-helix transcriptional regulator [Flavobacterium sp.]|uniref:helix-turn-helix domain-containing protein n=1 Tax=Flavobacterium sp. TaxID=239 RepID=UPI00260994E5|nr:helix-turn-helix transcriptional regulator [Flavobacterium sp.]